MQQHVLLELLTYMGINRSKWLCMYVYVQRLCHGIATYLHAEPATPDPATMHASLPVISSLLIVIMWPVGR